MEGIDRQSGGGPADEEEMLQRFLSESEQLLRSKSPKLTEDKLQEILRFMKFTFLEDLHEIRSKQ